MNNLEIIEKLCTDHDASDTELLHLIESQEDTELLFDRADTVRREYYGTAVYIRGLIEFTNYCKNNCHYCGIRAENAKADRYRLTDEQILNCCDTGYRLGFRTFVLQGGEDPFYTDERIATLVSAIKKSHPDCAVTLSLGERSRESFARLFDAGADRYLLRHETADEAHYASLHPNSMSLKNRKQCLLQLKELGYQTGSGFMVGSPGQTGAHLVKDLRFLQELKPDMIGIGPFIPHKDTPLKDTAAGTLSLTLRMLAILRLMFPTALLPATTALGTIHPQGRELGLKAGANVVMPNLSPVDVRKLYSLYDHKICTGEEAAECLQCLKNRVKSAGFEIVVDRGDAIKA